MIARLVRELDVALRERTPATAAGFFCVATLPLLLVLWGLQAHALGDAAARAAYRPDLLALTQQALTALLIWQLALASAAWMARGSVLADCRGWAPAAIGPTLAVWLALGVGYGLKDTPLSMFLVEVLVFARALFPLRQVLPWLALLAAIVLGAQAALLLGWMDYAPLLTQPFFNGQPLTPWWTLWGRLMFVTCVWPFAGAVFFLFGSLARHRQELESLVRTDALTGLYNRREFMERLSRESHRQQRHGEALSVLMLDVDHFKRINDQFGHPAGDLVLTHLGALLRGCVRQDIDVAARLGGEEFALLLPNTDALGAQRVARKVFEAVQALGLSWEGQPLPVTVSAGVAEVRQGRGEAALREADHNLYAAKRQGRNRLVASVPGPAPQQEAVP